MNLPYSITTQTGTRIDFSFPLHDETGSPVQVNQLVTRLLGALDGEIRTLGEVSNGDVLQALAITLAARAAMIEAPLASSVPLIEQLLGRALRAASEGQRRQPTSGHA
ncbi:hypothetical protein SAMN06265365_101528 [Tistlia consotensis]|uniref:Uncharacterized protein n=1 Tax=Tistlia consotensis USBA 355 TaxID=560819 RepID=A0A1Y6B554_9PROT|nr:hypothetical protein [Tistlia consotensis]SME92784.1 hypothetical protein SAMN05428998_101526 [Tistlia consotensis USBA 355]SNR28226.1 hypothetical protein SAMN06265365_101528 [Tistlia consotensis]